MNHTTPVHWNQSVLTITNEVVTSSSSWLLKNLGRNFHLDEADRALRYARTRALVLRGKCFLNR
jgi:hypothetical protein